ncbi:MerR family transcriptional regulator [Paenibacillus sp. Z6-24]
MKTETTFTIRQAAQQTGISEDNIRYYEKISLLPRAERKENGHRIYREQDVQTIQFISCLKRTGMSLEEMRPFLHVSANRDPAEYPELVERLRNHRDHIREQIASLQKVADFVDQKLAEGKYLKSFTPEQRKECADREAAESSEKFVSSVQMNYFPTPVKAATK